MVLMSEADLERRARRAYERGRLRSALEIGAFVAPVATVGLVHCTRPALSIACITLLTLAVIVCLYRGCDLERGARVGLAAGLAPFLLPIGAQGVGVYCAAPLFCASLPVVCIMGGVIGGIVLGFRGPRPLADQRSFWVAAATVTLTAGSIGCVLAGLSGLAGLGAGLVLGATPVIVTRAA